MPLGTVPLHFRVDTDKDFLDETIPRKVGLTRHQIWQQTFLEGPMNASLSTTKTILIDFDVLLK